MRYFMIRQDTNLPQGISLRDYDLNRRSIYPWTENKTAIEQQQLLFLSGRGDATRPDLIEHPFLMVSDAIKGILALHQDNLVFRSVVLIHQQHQLQYQYYHMTLPQLDAASGKTEYYPNGMIKNLVIDSGKIGAHQLFYCRPPSASGGLTGVVHPIAGLTVVESLLRRRVSGILFQEVEVG